MYGFLISRRHTFTSARLETTTLVISLARNFSHARSRMAKKCFSLFLVPASKRLGSSNAFLARYKSISASAWIRASIVDIRASSPRWRAIFVEAYEAATLGFDAKKNPSRELSQSFAEPRYSALKRSNL